jgi:hypothetical protein
MQVTFAGKTSSFLYYGEIVPKLTDVLAHLHENHPGGAPTHLIHESEDHFISFIGTDEQLKTVLELYPDRPLRFRCGGAVQEVTEGVVKQSSVPEQESVVKDVVVPPRLHVLPWFVPLSFIYLIGAITMPLVFLSPIIIVFQLFLFWTITISTCNAFKRCWYKISNFSEEVWSELGALIEFGFAKAESEARGHRTCTCVH